MFAIILLHALLALVAGLSGRRLGRRVLLVGALAPAAALAVTAAQTAAILGGSTWEEQVPWVAELGLTLTLRLDGFSLLFWWLIAGIGVLVFVYASRYFTDRPDLGVFTAMLVSFAGAMLLVVASDNLLALYVGWELTSLTSYLLIGFKHEDPVARAAARQALLVTTLGGLALLGGVVLVAQAAGTYSLFAVLADLPTTTGAQVGLALILLGAFSKSAQVPFHFWLPGAMAAPTPVSAYLHSATMVKAGVYLVARFSPAAAEAVAWWVPVVVGVGAATMLLGGWRALRAVDLKSLLAFGTASQLGFMILLLGTGAPDLVHAGVAVILAHALFKATLFLAVGVVDHAAGTRELHRLHGVGRSMPITVAAAAITAASMAGLFPLLGFVAKEAALEGALHEMLAGGAVTAVIVIGSALTAAYALRLLWGAFARKAQGELADEYSSADDVARPELSFELPATILAGLTVIFGLWVGPADALVLSASTALDEATQGLHLKLWHGFGPALWLSLLALVAGYAIYRARGVVEAIGAWTGRVPEATDGYGRSLRALDRTADRVTAIVQPGSLPWYAAVVLMTAVVLPGSALVRGFSIPDGLAFAESPLQALTTAVVIVAAVATIFIRRRLGAVLLLGAVGFGVAVLFIIQGAPDLALTQLLIETLALALFVVVLRRLPEYFDSVPWRFGQGVRIVVASAVGLFVGVSVLWAATGGRLGTAKEEFLARALPEGGGKNVVNVILTDFRAFDTLGEITVLLVAALGIAALVRPSKDPEPADGGTPPADGIDDELEPDPEPVPAQGEQP